MSNIYLDNYANEIAYREDTRKLDNLLPVNASTHHQIMIGKAIGKVITDK